MTLMSDVEKLRVDLERLTARVELNSRLAENHEQQISGDRGITDTLRLLADEIKSLRADLKTVASKLAAIEASVAEWTAVAKALAEKGVSTRMFVVGVLALLVPVIGLVIALATTGHA